MESFGGCGVISRRAILAGVLAGVAGPALAEIITQSPIPPRRPGLPKIARVDASEIDRLIAAAKLGGGSVAFAVADAATGQILAARTPDMMMPPASVLKSITSLYALERLGPAYRYGTRVLATGPVLGGIIQGDLVLVGAGDPTVQTDQLGDLAARLAAAGVKGVTGRFVTWAGALPTLAEISEEQPVQVGYNPGLSGLNLNFNRVYFEWKRAGADWRVTMDARGERFVPLVQMARVRVVGREAPLFTYATKGQQDDWTVASGALGKGGSRWLPVRHPAGYVADVFRVLAAAQGLVLPVVTEVGVVPKGQELATLQSDPLTDVLRDMLRFSTNLTAEAVGLRSSGAASLISSGAAMTDWSRERMGLSGKFTDHSGLGSHSRISPADMVKALVWANRTGAGLKPILRAYAMRDDMGAEIAGHPVKVVAKSGTLNFASGLAGHILPPGGRELVFAIFSADIAQRATLAEAEREDPPGGQGWTRRSRRLQWQLISRWAAAYG